MQFAVIRPASAVVAIVAGLTLSAPAWAASAQKVAIHGTASPAASRTPRVGSVAGGTSMDFQVIMKLPDQASADQFAQSVSTPGSAQYGKFLTPTEWEQRFSPTQAQVDEVKSFLSSNGFSVKNVSPDRLTVEATGDASRVENVFDTTLSYHRVQGQSLLLEDNNLSVPSDIAGLVEGVSGLSTTLAHPDNTTGAASSTSAAQPAAAGPIPPPAGFRVAPPCGTFYGQQIDTTLPPFGQGYPGNPPWAVCGYTPPQIRSAYGLNNQTDGSGVTVAIVDAYASPTLLSDAQEYASKNDPSHPLPSSQFSENVAKKFNQVNQCGASDWFGEQSLDVEAVHGVAPGANILYVGTKNCSNLFNGIQKVVDKHLASIVTDSWGDNGGDFLETPAERSGTDELLEMAASTGVSVLFSSGDDGDEFTTVGTVSPDYPASSPWVTSVGGTSLSVGANGRTAGEFGWSTARSFLCNQTLVDEQGCTSDQLNQWLPIDLALDGGSGGGTSYDYPQPFYQRGVVPNALSTANAGITGPNGVVGNQPMRVEPDISLDADPATGYLEGETQTFPNGVFYDQYRIGGTSLSSPLLAGVLARVDQQRGSSVGFANPALYSLSGGSSISDVLPAGKLDQSRSDFANSLDPSDGFLFTTRIIDYEGPEQFCDPTSNVCSTRNVALNVRRGYDNMTGLGAPTTGFVQALARR
ncbi:MAG TPA: S53 family peptidase [Solirubrobacteraceae bacterium]